MNNKKLKVLGVPWHTTHQYSLAQLSFFGQYDLLIEPWRKGFATEQRPFPPNMRYVTEAQKGYYDFALLHVDQQCIYRPEEGERISKGRLYMEARQTIKEVDPDLPIIVINHMVPFHDKYDPPYVVDYIKKIIDGSPMVVNTYEAAKQWGFGHTITHGLKAEDWPVLQKEPRVSIVMSPAGMERAYRREFGNAVLKRLLEMKVPVEWIGLTKGQFKTFEAYQDYVGRNLIHFFPGWQSPRPRARTEAMFAGSCIVTTPGQDAVDFIKSGSLKQKKDDLGNIVDEELLYDDDTNGFLTSMNKQVDPRLFSNPDYTAALIRNLVLENPDVALEIGLRGRETAMEQMQHEHFEKQWREFLTKLNILK